MRYFIYETVAKEAGIPPDKLEALCRLIRREFPRSDMLYELHVLRACSAIRDGALTIDEALSEDSSPPDPESS